MMDFQPVARIAILAPMPSELKPLIRLLSLKPVGSDDGEIFHCILGSIEIVATTTGIGTAAAKGRTETVLDSSPVDHLVVAGIAGGIGPSVDIGDLVIPESVIDLSSQLEYRPNKLGLIASRGGLVTSDDTPLDLTEVAGLENQGVIAVDMETAAIAEVCESRNCSWSVFRAISDRADDGSMDEAIFSLAGPDGEPNFPALLRLIFTQPKRIPQLIGLARGASLAAEVAASAVVSAIRETFVS
jgi:nucleoside phosphorylase